MQNGPISLSIKLPSRSTFEIVDTTGPLVGHIKDAIIARFKHRFSGIDPDQLLLYKLDGSGSRVLLDSTQLLGEAGISERAQLIVDYTDATQIPRGGV
jgi:hypothetical protein